MAIVNNQLISNTLLATNVNDGGETTSVVTLALKGGITISVISHHRYENHETKTKREIVGLPANIDIVCKSLVTWETPRTLAEVIKVFIGGEVDVCLVNTLL